MAYRQERGGSIIHTVHIIASVLAIAVTIASLAAGPAAAATPRAAAGGHLVVLLGVPRKGAPLTQVATVSPAGGALRSVGSPARYLGVAAGRQAGPLALGSPSGLYLLSVDSGKPNHVQPAGAPALLSRPAWSPDGRRLAFLAATQSPRVVSMPALWQADRSGRNARQVLDAAHTSDLLTVTWSPDGKSLLLSRFARGQGAVSLLDLASRRERPLVHGFDAVYSPDGHSIAYTVRGKPGHAHVFVYDVRTGRSTQVGLGGLAQTAVPVWSPDGASLAFFGTRSSTPTFIQSYDLYTAPAGGGTPVRVATGVTQVLPVGQAALAWTGA